MSTSKSKPTGNRRRNRKKYGEGKEFPVKKPKQSSPVKKMKDEVKVIKEVETKKANHLLKMVGGHGTDTRSRQSHSAAAVKEQLVVAGQDPTLDIDVGYDDRALQYLALGTVLRAIRRGWLTTQTSQEQHPYYAWRYLLGAYRSAATGSIPALQQAPIYFWEICYALKPKTEKFKTGGIKYNTAVADPLGDAADPAIAYSLGPTEEDYHVYWGTTAGEEPAINGFSILFPPSATYTEALGAASINYLWSTFPNSGLNKLVADPGTDAFMLNDTSAQAVVYPELGSSYGVAAGMATTAYSERFIRSPIMAKFAAYQEFDFNWRGWHEYRQSAGSPTYVGPRASEMVSASQFTNKAAPVFLMYNFDEFVEVGALILCLIQESVFNTLTQQIYAYPLTSLQFQIMLRQTMLPYFNNDMAQDLRFSGYQTDDILVTMLPLVVGPNGNSVTQQGEGMLMPRFFVETLRCCRRLTSVLQSRGKDTSNEIDLVPILGRPGSIAQLGQYTYQANGEVGTPLFKVVEDEVPIDLIECSAPSDQNNVYLDLNGPMLSKLISEHNNWMRQATGVLTALLDASSNEEGIACLNLNVVTNHLNYVFTPSNTTSTTTVPAVDVKGKKIPRSAIPTHRKHRGVVRPKVPDQKTVANNSRLQKGFSKKQLVKTAGIKYEPRRVGAVPDTDSTYFRDNVGIVKCSSTFPLISAIWKYQQLMIKPIFWVTANQLQGCTKMYQAFQVQPHTLPISAKTPIFVVVDGQLSMPSMYDQHLNMANMDIKAFNSTTKSEMEIDFDEFEKSGNGGFFAEVGKIIGGLIDCL
jgi:hypothetical protein